MTNILAGLFIGVGVFWLILAAIGIHKYHDFFYKIHIVSKGPSLGIMFLLVGVALYFGTAAITVKCIAVAIFVFITVPVSSSIVALTRYESTYGKLDEKE